MFSIVLLLSKLPVAPLLVVACSARFSTAEAGDASVADNSEKEDFTEAQLEATILKRVQDALRRIGNGTYRKCLVDGISTSH